MVVSLPYLNVVINCFGLRKLNPDVCLLPEPWEDVPEESIINERLNHITIAFRVKIVIDEQHRHLGSFQSVINVSC